MKLEYLIDGKPLEKNIGAVGELLLDESVTGFFEQIERTLHNSEFKQPLLDQLRNIYASGSTLNTSFAKLLNVFFDDAGLVFISSNDKRLKQLLIPIFQKEIQEYPHVSQLIIQQSAELEDRYHAQIKTKALNIGKLFGNKN